MRDYWAQQRERRPSVYILFDLGLTEKMIAEMMNCSLAIVNLDIKDHGGAESFPNRPKDPDLVLIAQLKQLADLHFNEKKWYNDDESCEIRNKLHGFLTKLPEISALKFFLNGMCLHQLWLENARTEMHDGYIKLLRKIGSSQINIDVFSKPPAVACDALTLEDTCFEYFLREIYAGKIPGNRHQARWRLLEIVMEKTDIENIIVRFDHTKMIEMLEQFLSSLDICDSRREQAIRMHEGIGTDRKYTLEEIGGEFGVIRERARQIESKGLQKLRGAWQHVVSICDTLTNIGKLSKMVKNIQTELTSTQEELQRTREKLVETNNQLRISQLPNNCPSLQILDQRISDYPFSTRVNNGLIRAGVKYIGQLIQMTKEQLSKISNLGEGSVKEVKEVLHALTPPLHIDTDVGKWTPPKN